MNEQSSICTVSVKMLEEVSHVRQQKILDEPTGRGFILDFAYSRRSSATEIFAISAGESSLPSWNSFYTRKIDETGAFGAQHAGFELGALAQCFVSE